MRYDDRLHAVITVMVCTALGLVSAWSDELRTPPLKPGSLWKHPTTGREMVYVPSSVITPISTNKFGADIPLSQMGHEGMVVACLKTVRQCPLFVTGFWMDKEEVTNRDYAEFLKATGRQPLSSWPAGQYPQGRADHAVQVSYKDAQAYADWAGLRLPMVQEYFAATGNTEGRYPWTDDLSFNDIELGPVEATGPVSKNPQDVSPLGFRDLLGHALEWTDTRMNLAVSGEPVRGVFFLIDFGEGLHAWLGVPENWSRNAGFRCCCIPWAQLLAEHGSRLFDFSDSEQYGHKTVKVTVSNQSDTEIRFLSSSGLRATLEHGATKEILLVAGTYIFSAPSAESTSVSEVRFEVLTPEHEWPAPWGQDYCTFTVTNKGTRIDR